MITKRVFPILEAIFTVIVWGGTFIATKIALQEVSPATVVWLRFAMGVIILGAAVAMRKQFAMPERNEWLYFALLGFIGVTFHQWLQANGLVTAQATTTAWIVATTPIFIALFGWLVLKEKLGWLKIFGIALAAFGVLLIVSNGNFGALFAGKDWNHRRFTGLDQRAELGNLYRSLTPRVDTSSRGTHDVLCDAPGLALYQHLDFRIRSRLK